MTVMICKGMLSEPLSYGNGYVYEGAGEIIAALIVAVPTSLMFWYMLYKIIVTRGTLKEVRLENIQIYGLELLELKLLLVFSHFQRDFKNY